MIVAVLGAVYTDMNGDLNIWEALLRRFGILGWVETALKGEARIWHPKEELGVLARNEKVRYQVWIQKVDDCIAVLIGKLVNVVEEHLVHLKKRPEHTPYLLKYLAYWPYLSVM